MRNLRRERDAFLRKQGYCPEKIVTDEKINALLGLPENIWKHIIDKIVRRE